MTDAEKIEELYDRILIKDADGKLTAYNPTPQQCALMEAVEKMYRANHSETPKSSTTDGTDQ